MKGEIFTLYHRCHECGHKEDVEIKKTKWHWRWWIKYYVICSNCGTINDIWYGKPSLRHRLLNFISI